MKHTKRFVRPWTPSDGKLFIDWTDGIRTVLMEAMLIGKPAVTDDAEGQKKTLEFTEESRHYRLEMCQRHAGGSCHLTYSVTITRGDSTALLTFANVSRSIWGMEIRVNGKCVLGESVSTNPTIWHACLDKVIMWGHAICNWHYDKVAEQPKVRGTRRRVSRRDLDLLDQM
jgi:hypothetical protein